MEKPDTFLFLPSEPKLSGLSDSSERNYSDFAEVPDSAHFAEANTSLAVWVGSSILVFGMMWILYRRWRQRGS